MTKQSIPHNLYREASQALTDLLYYERPERFALRCVAEHGRRGEAVEKIFITTAQAALARHPISPRRHVHVA